MKKFNSFLEGCGHQDIITMCIIYLLAGAFATVSKAMGGVDATVNFGLTYIPAHYIAAGLFIIAAFISTATGTSVGSIVAITPIAVGLAEKSGVPMPLILAAVMGGSMFGDTSTTARLPALQWRPSLRTPWTASSRRFSFS